MMRKESLTRMAEVRGEWCVSLYMPVSAAGADAGENRKRLKKLTTEAANKLIALGVAPLKTTKMLGPVEMILENDGFWADRTDGFAAFFTPDSFVWHSMQYQFDELVVVTDRFHLKPLLRNSSRNRRFHLLALGQESNRFFEASRARIDEINLKGMPRYVANFFKDETAGELDAEEADKVFKAGLLNLYRRTDKAVITYLKDDEAPLIIVGDERCREIYREANRCRHLLDNGIDVDVEEVDRLTSSELLKKALPVMMPVFWAERENALRLYRDENQTGLATNDLSRIFKAAGDGRIRTLFVPVGRQTWGKFDRRSGELEIHDRAEPGDKDLLCVASTRALLKGGEVFVVRPEQMPDKSSIAAVLKS